MKKLIPLLFCFFLFSFTEQKKEMPVCYKAVDQVIWVVADLQNVISQWEKLGFNQVVMLDDAEMKQVKSGKIARIKVALANLAGANILLIQPVKGESVFTKFHQSYGDGAMSLVHRLDNAEALQDELERLKGVGLDVYDEINIKTSQGNLHYYLMNSREEGKYYLGFVSGNEGLKMREKLTSANLHNMKINQYAFAISNPEPVSQFWHRIGLPEFQINHPELGGKHYYGKTVNHDLIQGWQRQGTIAYEWCIPVSTPIVYDDHIKKHGEGIHHLAFTVDNMNKVLDDFTSKSFVVSMGGTWGTEGKPGFGRYEYIDLEKAGGLTMELLWSYKE